MRALSKQRSLSILIAIGFLLTGLQILACFAGIVPAIVCGILLPVASHYLLRFFDISFASAWVRPAIPACASLIGVGVLVAAEVAQSATPLWFAPLAAIGSALALKMLTARHARRCGLCNRHIAGEMAFLCPRCHLLVCEKNCWVFERLRCKLCEQNEVPLPWVGDQWWTSNFGPLARYGRCEYCKRPAQPAEPGIATPTLRPCKQCGRSQCQECWDYLNGQCSRCGWIVPNLPHELQMLMAVPQTSSTRNSDTNRYA